MKQEDIEVKIKDILIKLQSLQTTSHQYVMVRFLMVVCFCLSFYQGFQHERKLFVGICGILIILFIIIVNKHSKIKQEIEDEELLKEVYEDILKRKSDAWKSFSDDGSEFMEEQFTQAYDLDLLGKASLFQYLNVAETVAGKLALKDALIHQDSSIDEIVRRQQAIDELLQNPDMSATFMQLSKAFKKHAYYHKKQNLQITSIFSLHLHVSKFMEMICYGISMGTWIGLLLWALHIQSYLVFSICFTLSLCMSLLFSLKHQQNFQYIAKLHTLMNDYHRFFLAMDQATFKSSLLQELQSNIHPSIKAFKNLQWLLGFVQARNNIIFNVILNGLCLLDFHCMYHFSKFSQQYGKQLPYWFDAVAQLEMLLSLAQIGFAKDHANFPKISTNTIPTYQAQGLYHPLLQEQHVVRNDVILTNESYIITGSNMSGKTTFLRTLGINLVLAKAGSLVCANTMQVSIMSLYTSMRVHDDVSEGISTFYAEILRIKEMMQQSKQNQPMMVLIDEIFKGTNSADRIACAIQAIKRLHLPWVMTLVSTHDFELCKLAEDPFIHAINYHFAEYYQDDHICFDYQLKKGRSTSTNAQQLMRMAGFYDKES